MKDWAWTLVVPLLLAAPGAHAGTGRAEVPRGPVIDMHVHA